jgi:arabinose-5-phosphate isomerase
MSLETARRVLKIDAQAIQDVFARLTTPLKGPSTFFACKGRVVITGMGKSGLSDAISATLSSTGTLIFPSSCGRLHGDLGMLARGEHFRCS